MTPVRQFVAVRRQFVNELDELSSSVRQFVYRDELNYEPTRPHSPRSEPRQFVNALSPESADR